MTTPSSYFIAIPVPAEAGQWLAVSQPRLPGVVWNNIGDYHVTVAYLGEAATRQRQAILREWAEHMPVRQFPLQIDGRGVLLNKPTSALVAGVMHHTSLFHFLQSCCLAHDVPRHRYPTYTPHVTLATLPREQVGDVFSLTAHVPLPPPPIMVRHMQLYESRRTSDAARLTPLATLELAP